jgi:hypothetical protein
VAAGGQGILDGSEPDPSGGLLLVRRCDSLGMRYTEVVATDPASLAHVGFSVIAVTLGAVLRKALEEHLDEHGCGCGDIRHPSYIGGFLHCPEAKRLFDLLPDGDRILLA